MSTSTIDLQTRDASDALTPRRTGAVSTRLRRAGLALWYGLEAYGRAEAMRVLRDLHDRWEFSDPKLAQQLRKGTALLLAEDRRRGG